MDKIKVNQQLSSKIIKNGILCFFLVKYSLWGMLPGLVVNIEDSQFKPWSLDVSLIPGFTLKLNGPKDGRKTTIIIKTPKRGKSQQKKYIKSIRYSLFAIFRRLLMTSQPSGITF